jgi:hypothetical protein
MHCLLGNWEPGRQSIIKDTFFNYPSNEHGVCGARHGSKGVADARPTSSADKNSAATPYLASASPFFLIHNRGPSPAPASRLPPHCRACMLSASVPLSWFCPTRALPTVFSASSSASPGGWYMGTAVVLLRYCCGTAVGTCLALLTFLLRVLFDRTRCGCCLGRPCQARLLDAPVDLP